MVDPSSGNTGKMNRFRNPSPDATTGGRTLIDVLGELEERGYGAQVRSRPDGRVKCDECDEEVDAATLTVEHVERLEGASDPADMMLVAGVCCPNCEQRGTLVLTYGPMASQTDSDVERRLQHT